MDGTGDSRHEFDVADKAAVATAEQRFRELTGNGFLAIAPGQDGAPGTILKRFDATAEEVIFQPQLVGG
jgi:hypothetical protein